MLVKYSKHKSPSKKQYPTIIEELCHQFSLDDLRKSTNNFAEDREIGQTEFSIAYKGYLKHNGEIDYPIAVKRMRSTFNEWKFKKEIELNCQLHHPNLTSFIGFCDEKDEKILVYEYMFNGSLHSHLLSRDMESLSWKKRLEICIGAAKGLHYLHTGAKRAIFHCDIKPQTILLDKNMVPKLSHLGFSLQEKRSKSKPKPIKVNMLNDKSDVYSFGMVLLQIACTNYKHTIFDKMNMLENPNGILAELINPAKIISGEVAIFDKMDMLEIENTNWFFKKSFNPANFLERFPADKIIDPILMRLIAPQCLEVFMDIMKRCLNLEPNERPAMGEVEVELEHAHALQEEADY